MKSEFINFKTNLPTDIGDLICEEGLPINLGHPLKVILDELIKKIGENLNILNMQLEGEFSKSTIIYQMFFCLELLLKYHLTLTGVINLPKQYKDYSHNLNKLMEDISKSKYSHYFSEIEDKIKKIKISYPPAEELDKYADLKYNIYKNGIIFKNDMLSNKEKEVVKGVIQCIRELIMLKQ